MKGAISLNKNTLLKAAVFGLAVGDALGVPYEFRNRDTFTVIRMTSGGVHKQPKGTWSDDTGLTLATCYSIQKKGGIDLADMMRDFRAWLWHGAFTVDGRIFDVGNTCGQAINVGHGLGREDKQGNGSLMRILPLAFLPGISDEAIADVSALTHDSSVCKELCIIYVHIARELIQGADLKTSISRSVSPDSNYRHLLDIENFPREEIGNTEHAPVAMTAALWCLSHTRSYKACVLAAVRLGGDTDTVAAIAGGLAGIMYGYRAIPKLWLMQLRGKNIIRGCLFPVSD